MAKLSDRVRPDVEAAPWVIEEIKELESLLARAVEHCEYSIRHKADWPCWALDAEKSIGDSENRFAGD